MDALAPHGALVLNPATAPRLESQPSLRSTAYTAKRLVVPTSIDILLARELLGDAAERFNYRVEIDERFSARPPSLGRFATAFTLEPARPEPTPPADAFQVLQWARSHALGRRLGG